MNATCAPKNRILRRGGSASDRRRYRRAMGLPSVGHIRDRALEELRQERKVERERILALRKQAEEQKKKQVAANKKVVEATVVAESNELNPSLDESFPIGTEQRVTVEDYGKSYNRRKGTVVGFQNVEGAMHVQLAFPKRKNPLLVLPEHLEAV